MENIKGIFEEYVGLTLDHNTMYIKLSVEDEIFIGNICEEYCIDFAIGTNHFTLFNKGE